MKLNNKTQLQSHSIKNIMEKHSIHPEYDLAMPLFYIKKKSLKKLNIDDVFLLGLNRLDLLLIRDERIYAKVVLESVAQTVKLNIIDIEMSDKESYNNSKYECIVCSFGKLQCRKLEVGHKVELFGFNALEIELYIGNKNFSKASLVKVDNEIAIKIIEVYSE